ncbi:MAG: type II toxin-antitoxin system RelE/ParE family toxin [Candidatus Cryptobacteroides sp.]
MEHLLYICCILEDLTMGQSFKVIMSGEVDAFLSTLKQDVRAKIIYNVDKVANGFMDKDLFKKLENTDIWEFRTLYKGIQYRLLAFWDTETETLVVATHGFIKKTQKTPRKEIAKAEAIRKMYFETKR